MDIASLSVDLSINNVLSKASTQVLKMTMEQMEVTSEQMAKMMELSVNPGLGANLDVRI